MAREAARILAALLERIEYGGESRGIVRITADIRADLFDRLTVWGAAAEDFKDDDPVEDDGDGEPERAW